jgi:hypothetical protein
MLDAQHAEPSRPGGLLLVSGLTELVEFHAGRMAGGILRVIPTAMETTMGTANQ